MPHTALAVSRYNKQRRRLAKGVAAELDAVQEAILQDPHRGDRKKEQLRNVWVENFRADNDQWLVAYEIDTKAQTVTFLSIRQQENFYRNLTRNRELLREKGNCSIPAEALTDRIFELPPDGRWSIATFRSDIDEIPRRHATVIEEGCDERDR